MCIKSNSFFLQICGSEYENTHFFGKYEFANFLQRYPFISEFQNKDAYSRQSDYELLGAYVRGERIQFVIKALVPLDLLTKCPHLCESQCSFISDYHLKSETCTLWYMKLSQIRGAREFFLHVIKHVANLHIQVFRGSYQFLYLNIGCCYCHNVIITGTCGSGKTTLYAYQNKTSILNYVAYF